MYLDVYVIDRPPSGQLTRVLFYRSLTDREHTLGLGGKGVTTYFSSNCGADDSEKINRFFKEKNIEGYINRVIKTVKRIKTGLLF
jgi:hypothetical protein